MKEEEAVRLFDIAKAKGFLPQKLEDLVPLSFIGQAAVNFYRQKIKLMDQLKMTENQRKATLRDGQDAGEMLLDIETRIGELAEKEPDAKAITIKGPHGRIMEKRPSGEPRKHERLGIPEHRMKQSQAIAKHPEIVEKVKAQARENEDIPTRTAVINEIRYHKEKQRQLEVNSKHKEIKMVVAIEQTQYIMALDECISILPQKPPSKWNEDLLKEATTKARIIIKRLEEFK